MNKVVIVLGVWLALDLILGPFIGACMAFGMGTDEDRRRNGE